MSIISILCFKASYKLFRWLFIFSTILSSLNGVSTLNLPQFTIKSKVIELLDEEGGTSDFTMKLFTISALVILGGVFAGLTIGLMGLDETNLQVLMVAGDSKERIYARKVFELLKRGKHWIKEFQPMNSNSGVIDIGSNGIRFGLVSSLDRHLPVLYEERAPISLFDAQHSSKSGEKSNISENVIRDVENTMKRFNYMCRSYGVEIKDVTIVATEATRTAPNSSDFRERIKKSFQAPVKLLDKKEEAIVSGKGIAATYNGVEGLVMDMGGGSVEINYLKFDRKTAEFKISDSPINLPYGAAALTKLLTQNNTPEKLTELSNNIVQDLKVGLQA
ncbi:13282_t:CDS:2 [Entrophospora sp. SA101]|nr:13282_t:CDS:2 [Entrophospora sp. SA101]